MFTFMSTNINIVHNFLNTPSPIFSVDCGDPPPIPNAMITRAFTLAGETSIYECIDGYVSAADGLKEVGLKCLDDGEWEVPTEPKCLRK